MCRCTKLLCALVLPLLLLSLISISAFAQDTVPTSDEPLYQVTISVEGGEGHIIQNKGLDDEKNLFSTGINSSYTSGTKFNLTANETTCAFLYWKDVSSNRIISFDKNYVATLGTKLNIRAVFRSATTNSKLVVFQNKNGHIIKSEYVANDGSFTVAKDPSFYGYSFKGWSLNGILQSYEENDVVSASELSDTNIFVAQYDLKTQKYAVTVNGGHGSGSYKYNTKVTLSVDESAIPENKFFSHWASDDTVLSYDKSYSFCVGADTVIDAVYTDVPPEQIEPALSICVADVSISENKITFLSSRALPFDCELIENGILLNQSEAFNISSCSAKVTSLSNLPSGQFCVRKASASHSRRWYAKAYMIYKKDGVIHTVYSNVVNESTAI